MVHFVGLDVSVKTTSVCVVDDAGKVILEQKVATDPANIIAILTSLGVIFGRIGIEAGPLSQWLVNALTVAILPAMGRVLLIPISGAKAWSSISQPAARCSSPTSSALRPKRFPASPSARGSSRLGRRTSPGCQFPITKSARL